MAANKTHKIRTLRSGTDFQKLAKSRQRYFLNAWLMAKVLKNPQECRVGWTLPRNVGGAVTRNRLKRWTREYLRARAENLKDIRFDVNLVFRGQGKDSLKAVKREELEIELRKLFTILSSASR